MSHNLFHLFCAAIHATRSYTYFRNIKQKKHQPLQYQNGLTELSCAPHALMLSNGQLCQIFLYGKIFIAKSDRSVHSNRSIIFSHQLNLRALSPLAHKLTEAQRANGK